MARRPSPSKYQPLGAYLAELDTDEVTLTLAEIEASIGQVLPDSARGRVWWANTLDRPSARAWLTAGWLVATTELRTGAETVTFARHPAGPDQQPFGAH